MIEMNRFPEAMICWLGLAILPSPAWAWSEADIDPIAQITLEAETAPRETTGASASIVFKDGHTWSGAAGYADAAGTRRLSASDAMRIGSQTKTYTGTLVLELVDQKLIGLDDTLAKWLPELKVPNDDKITVRNLLDMTSGIPDYLSAPVPGQGGGTIIDEWVAKRGKLAYPDGALVELTNPMQHGPIGTMDYSNTNFLLLGMIAEKAACKSQPKPGCSFVSELQRRVLEPLCAKQLCLVHTSFPTDDTFTVTHSDGYARAVDGTLKDQAGTADPDANTYVSFTTIDPSVPAFAGAMISSATDETVWLRQLVTNNGSLLSPSMQNKRLTETVTGDIAGIPARYGLGIYYMKSLLNDAELVGHGGTIYGYTSGVFRRTDTQTDYTANVSTFFLTDQFSAPILVWVLDRNVWNGTNANGQCNAKTPKTDTICSGVSVMQKPLVATGGTLTLKPSGRSDATYVPYATPPVIKGTMAVPTVAFYQHGSSGIDLQQAARLTVEPGAALSMTGNHSSAVTLSGDANTVEVAGTVTTTGVGVSGIRDQGTGSRMTIKDKGAVTGSVVWWDPDLPAVAESTYVVARPDDTSTAVLLSGNGSTSKVAANVTIDGLVRTQRLGTAAVRLLPGSRDYRLVVGPTGRIIGPVVMQGEGAALDIEAGGKALYVAESVDALPSTPNASESLDQQLRDRDGAVPRAVLSSRPFRSVGAPGMPSIPRAAVLASRASARAAAAANRSRPGAGAPQDERVPAVVVSLAGSRNAVTVGGTIFGTIPEDSGTTYTSNLVAVNEAGVQSKVSVEKTGLIIGNVVSSGTKPTLEIDGTIKGNVTIKDPSVVIAGSGTITGTLTIADKPVERNGNLKIGGRPQ